MKPIHLNCRCCCWWFHLCGAAIAVVTVVVVSIRVLHSYQTVAVRTVGYFKFLIKRKTAVISASEKRQQKIDLTQKRIELIKFLPHLCRSRRRICFVLCPLSAAGTSVPLGAPSA